MALIFIFTVIELFFSDFLVALPAVEVTLSNAFSQSVLFRIREGVNIVYDSMLAVILLHAALVIDNFLPTTTWQRPQL